MDLCRKKGVISYEGPMAIGDYHSHGKMLFGPPPPTPKDLAKRAEVDPLFTKRRHYMDLLGRGHISDEELANLPDGV